jgi:hypothetical protein
VQRNKEERGQSNMIQDIVKDKLDAVRGLSSEDVLGSLGMQRKRSTLEMVLPAAGIFAAGILVGSGVALLLAPKSGRELRRDIKGKANEITQRVGASAEHIAQEVRESLPHRGEGSGGPTTLDSVTRAERKPGEAHDHGSPPPFASRASAAHPK